MKSIVFDTGPLISLSLNNLLWILEPMKKRFNGEFYITESVKKELVDRPLNIRRFKFEALQLIKLIESGILVVLNETKFTRKTKQLMDMANRTFKTHGRYLTLVHYAEIASVACALDLNAQAVVIDERTTRLMIEDQKCLQNILQHKLHRSTVPQKDHLAEFKKETKGLRVIRSVEFAVLAFEFGLLDSFTPKKMANPKRTLLDAVLWGIKLHGASISSQEIHDIISDET